MKTLRFIIILSFFLLHSYFSYATGCDGDVLYINGVRWELLGKPIAYIDSVSYARFMDFLPKERSWSTANWEGYTGYWTIKDQQLYLLKVEVKMYDKEKDENSIITLDADTLKNIFAPYYTQRGILARWFSREGARAGKGKLIRYVHMAFDRNVEEEYTMTIRDGKVIEEQFWHNSKTAGIELGDVQSILTKHFPIHLFPELKGKRLIITMKNVEMLPDGHFVDCEVAIRFPNTTEFMRDQNHSLIIALKDIMRSIYPWEVLCIHGKYTMECSIFTFPLLLEKKE